MFLILADGVLQFPIWKLETRPVKPPTVGLNLQNALPTGSQKGVQGVLFRTSGSP